MPPGENYTSSGEGGWERGNWHGACIQPYAHPTDQPVTSISVLGAPIRPDRPDTSPSSQRRSEVPDCPRLWFLHPVPPRAATFPPAPGSVPGGLACVRLACSLVRTAVLPPQAVLSA